MTYSAASNLPDYVILNDPQEKRVAVLSNPAEPLKFPFSDEDKESVRILVAKYDQAEKCAGLAAPQIGIGKQIIVFEVPDDEDFKKFRPDLLQTMPKSVWINPRYQPIGEEMTTAIEGCFSVRDIAGPVGRYTKIHYEAFTPEGIPVEGVAEGYLARVIQHEIDHINGRCFIDLVPEGERFSMDEYWKKRQAAIDG